MNPDLLILRDLLTIDQQMDALKDEAAALAAAVRRLRGQDAALDAESGFLDQQLGQARLEESELSRQHIGYSQKRDRTRALIDQGKAPDFAAAQRQHAQLTELADRLETELLEAMEAREELEGRIEALGERRRETRRDLEAARATEAKQRPRLSDAYNGLKADRRRTAGTAPRHLLQRYDELRRRKVVPVVDVVDGACPGCHLRPPPQVPVDLPRKDGPIHNCRGCGAFFFGVRDTRTDEDADGGDDADA